MGQRPTEGAGLPPRLPPLQPGRPPRSLDQTAPWPPAQQRALVRGSRGQAECLSPQTSHAGGHTGGPEPGMLGSLPHEAGRLPRQGHPRHLGGSQGQASCTGAALWPQGAGRGVARSDPAGGVIPLLRCPAPAPPQAESRRAPWHPLPRGTQVNVPRVGELPQGLTFPTSPARRWGLGLRGGGRASGELFLTPGPGHLSAQNFQLTGRQRVPRRSPGGRSHAPQPGATGPWTESEPCAAPPPAPPHSGAQRPPQGPGG